MTGTAVVTVVHDRHDHLDRQRASLALSALAPDHHVVVAVDDPVVATADWCATSLPADPLGLPIAAARNRGAEVAIARGADVLVFLDVDCLVDPGLVEAYAEVVRDEPQIVWSGPVTYLERPPPGGYDLATLTALDSPHPSRPAPGFGVRIRDADPDLFWSLSFACSVDAWHRMGGFCEDYVGYGGEDTDFARKVAASDLGLGWVGDARAYHQWHPVSRPPAEHVADIVRNAEIYRRRWGTTPMLGWLEAFEERGLVSRGDGGDWLVTG